jgi:hypothetical protein
VETEALAVKVELEGLVVWEAKAEGLQTMTMQDLVAMVARVETEEMVGAEVVAQVVLHSPFTSMAHPPIHCVKGTFSRFKALLALAGGVVQAI